MDNGFLILSYYPWFGEEVGPEYEPDAIVDESLVVTGGLNPVENGGPWIEIRGHCDPIPVEYESETLDIVADLKPGERFVEPVTFDTYAFCGRSSPFLYIQGGWLIGGIESPGKFSIELDEEDIWRLIAHDMKNFQGGVPVVPISSYVLAGLAAISPQAVDAVRERLEALGNMWSRAFRCREALSWDLEKRDADLALPRRILYGEGPITIGQIQEFLECSRTTLYNLRRAHAARCGMSKKPFPKTYLASVVRREMLLPLLQSRQGRSLRQRMRELAIRFGSKPPDIGRYI